MFVKVSNNELPDFNSVVTEHFYRQGQVLFYKGHLPCGLFILTRGDLKLNYDNQSNSIIKPFMLLGSTVFDDRTQPYPATAEAHSDCELKFLSLRAYQDLPQTNVRVLNWLEQQIEQPRIQKYSGSGF